MRKRAHLGVPLAKSSSAHERDRGSPGVCVLHWQIDANTLVQVGGEHSRHFDLASTRQLLRSTRAAHTPWVMKQFNLGDLHSAAPAKCTRHDPTLHAT